ncbi:MAG: PHP domain-containing protein [Planctomycetota bacterium]
MSDEIRGDFHIHTKYLGCANETMEIPAIVAECRRLGVTRLGITDHLNTLEKLDLHLRIREDLASVETPIDLYFGVELNFIASDGPFAFGAEIKERYGFQFAIGGIHRTYLEDCDLEKIVEIQHRHHIRTCRDPLVDVLVHPYWLSPGEFRRKGWPLPESVSFVPESLARELGQVARDTGTAIEINGGANLANPNYADDYAKSYLEYLAIVAEEGPRFMLGSDAHNLGRLSDSQAAWSAAEKLGLSAERIWTPPCAPFSPGAGGS